MTRQLYLASRPFAIEWDRVVTFTDEGGWDAATRSCIRVRTPPRALAWAPPQDFGEPPCRGPTGFGDGASDGHAAQRYSHRPGCAHLSGDALLAAAQQQIRQVIVHHDGCASSAMCFHVLHNQRGLSCHFLVDNDGTIYQTLDLALAAWHARGHNDIAVGIEVCSRADAGAVIGATDDWGRTPETCTVHGTTLLAWGFSVEQRRALAALARALRRMLPGVPLEFPRGADGGQAWDVIEAPYSFAGWLGHYHTTARKWDPGPFDFASFVREVGGDVYHPIPLGDTDQADPVATDPAQRAEELDLLHQRSEASGCGLFPLGPYCEYQLWHGGAHLPARLGTPVYAILPGRLIAARVGDTSGAGSTSFALVRHDVLGARRAIYSLYYHLDARASAWADDWRRAALAQPGRVVRLDRPIDAGAQVGRVGPAGPDRDPQLHLEIFALVRVDDDPDLPAPFELREAAPGDRFCDDDELLGRLDDPEPPYQPSAIAEAYRRDPIFRRLVVRACSEWSPRCGGDDWTAALRARTPRLERRDVAALVRAQIEPVLWWTDEVSAALGLPRDAYVYHYQPVTFVGWIAERLAARADAAEARRRRFSDVVDGADAPEDVDADALADAHDPGAEGDDYVRCREQLEIERAVAGYEGDPACWPWTADAP